jgi:CBS domain-containing protein
MSELTTSIGKLLKHKPRSVWSTTPDASVYDCIELMAEKEVGALLVMEHNKLLGIISERDYARKVILQGKSSKETTVAKIMSSPVIFVSLQHSVGDCMRTITDNRIRHLPVMEGGAVIGVISIGDLVNWVISEQEETIRHLQAYISGAAPLT